MSITYVKGDATQPIGTGNKIIVHICNDVGAWGAGFVMALSRRWKSPEMFYREWFEGVYETPFELGQVQPVKVTPDIYVCNLIGQEGLHAKGGLAPIRYDAVQNGLKRVWQIAKSLKASIHMPRIGCGLAGGNWETVGKIVEQELGGFSVTVYDLQ